MLAAIGMFVFDTQTLLPDRIGRDRAWRHARDDRFLAPAASQFVGPGDDKVTITGTLVPELAGSASAIETLAEMANEGEAWPLMDGTGTILAPTPSTVWPTKARC
jgi:phage protein U